MLEQQQEPQPQLCMCGLHLHAIHGILFLVFSSSLKMMMMQMQKLLLLLIRELFWIFLMRMMIITMIHNPFLQNGRPRCKCLHLDCHQCRCRKAGIPVSFHCQFIVFKGCKSLSISIFPATNSQGTLQFE